MVLLVEAAATREYEKPGAVLGAWCNGLVASALGTKSASLRLHVTGGSRSLRVFSWGSGAKVLNWVAATSACNAWAVGYYTQDTTFGR